MVMDDICISHNEALLETGFWGNAGAGCIVQAEDTGRYLISLRSEEVQEPLTWGVIGGAIDSNEDPLNAAIRELKEETRYNGPIIGSQKLHVFNKGSFKYTTFMIIVPSEFTPILDWESKDAQWFERGKWPAPLHFGLEEIIKTGKL